MIRPKRRIRSEVECGTLRGTLRDTVLGHLPGHSGTLFLAAEYPVSDLAVTSRDTCRDTPGHFLPALADTAPLSPYRGRGAVRRPRGAEASEAVRPKRQACSPFEEAKR